MFLPLLLEISDAGGINSKLKADPGLRNGVYIFNGTLTNETIGRIYDLPSRDLNLLMAAF